MIEELYARLTYRADKIDGWKILAAIGPVEGDCDDYCVTALWLLEGRSMLNFWGALLKGRAKLWYCIDAIGQDHMCLWHRDYGWTDIQFPAWSPEPMHNLTHGALPSAPMKMLVGKLFR